MCSKLLVECYDKHGIYGRYSDFVSVGEVQVSRIHPPVQHFSFVVQGSATEELLQKMSYFYA